MKRTLALLAVAAAVAPVASAAASPHARLTQARGSVFPSRTFVLTLPTRMKLTSDRVHVTENGKPVVDVEVIPAQTADRGRFGVVLAVDASASMRGGPIRGAVRAARAFLAERAPGQQVAILTFNSDTHVIAPFTTDSEALQGALASEPTLAVGTHVYDAVQSGLDMLATAHVTAGSIVVLSDGADTGSATSATAVTQAAQDAHVRVFSVGLRSEQFSPAPLRALARSTRGDYAEAGAAAELGRIYKGLGLLLSREYLLNYRSLAGPGLGVNVVVSVDGRGAGSSASASYTTPRLKRSAAPPYHRSVVDAALQSTLLAALISVFAALLVSVGVAAVARPTRPTLRARISEFVSVGVAKPKDDDHSRLSERVLGGAEKSLERTRLWVRFKEELELADIKLPAVQVVLWSFVGAVGLGWFLAQATGTTVFGAFGIFVPIFVLEFVRRRVRRKRDLFAEQLPDNLQVMASALRAGHALVSALSVVVDDSAEPTKSEFRRVIADERLGVPLEDALAVVVRRMQSRDLEQVALVAAVQRQTGGNAAEVIDRVVDTLRERADLRRLVKTLTSQGTLARWILTGLPVVLAGVISILNPGYLDPLFSTATGQKLLVLAVAMLIAGSLIIRKIVDIKL